jgi:putative SOS response-associated peptidase YedK
MVTILFRTEIGWKMSRSLWAWKVGQGEISHNMINARSEGIFSQNAFRFAIRNCRCVIPVDSFYSLTKHPGREVRANRIYAGEGRPLFVAALTTQDRQCVNPITGSATNQISDICDRQLILFDNKADIQAWCDPELKVSQLDTLLKRSLQLPLTYYAITTDIEKSVNSPILHERRHRHLTLFD